MPGPGELAQRPAPIIGREAGLARLRGLVDQVPLAGQVLLVTGEAGMGKTVLLAEAAARARSAGMRVLPVTGRESESRLAFAGLHQLLRPVLSSTADLPARQAQALMGALGLAEEPIAPDPLLTGVAVLTLLSDLSERSPVLVVADDAQWLDRSSLERAGLRPAPAWTPSGPGCWWAPAGKPRLPALTGVSRNCTSDRCPRRTPACCWTGSPALPGGGPGCRYSPRPCLSQSDGADRVGQGDRRRSGRQQAVGRRAGAPD